MGPTHAQIRALVEQALDLDSAAEREQLLAACGDPDLAAEARALLGLETEVHSLDQGALHLAQMEYKAPLPTHFGPYRVLGVLGQGGMGDVYLGVRDDGSFRKEVAIKVVRDLYSAEQQQRFLRERKLLARLEHPAIAQVLDGGSTASGQAWMAIERVDGVPLDQYARKHGLGVRERVALMLRVLDGVQYAHQNLVVHRDLKPSNVLVQADGQPKLLDFGIAKQLGESDHTQTQTRGSAPMTLAYAAPEQIRGGAITAATDVYALGVVLYELLAGERPHKIRGDNPLSLLQAITDTDATAPSESLRRRGTDTTTDSPFAARELKGDLDTIVLKALSRDPLRRYPSAQSMRDDLERFLGHQPIKARPDSFGYRARKWVRRNRTSSALVASLVLVLAVAAVWIVRERNHALEQAEVADATKRFLIRTFSAANRWKSGREVSAMDLTLQGLEQVATELKDYPEARIEMYDVLGHTLGRASPLAQGARARELQVAELRKLEPATSPRLIAAEFELAASYWYAEMLPETRAQVGHLSARYASSMPTWVAVGLDTMHIDPMRFQGDYRSALDLIENRLPTWLATTPRLSEDRRRSMRVIRAHTEWARLDAMRFARRDGQARQSSLATLRYAAQDLAEDPAVRANYTGFAFAPQLALSVERRTRLRNWVAMHFGDSGGFTVWLDQKLLDCAIQADELAAAQILYDRLQTVLSRFPDEAVFELRDLDLSGAQLALAQGNPTLAAERWQKALALAQYSDANLIFPSAAPFESRHTRAALAGLAWLDAQQTGSLEPLQAVLRRQAEHDDGDWRQSAAWLAQGHLAQEQPRAARALMQQILDWQQQRGADPDVRLDALFARFQLRQHPAVSLPPEAQAELEQLFDANLAAGEQYTAGLQRKAY